MTIGTREHFKDISIKRKLIIIIMLTSIVVLSLASAAFLINDLVSFRNSMVDDLKTLARIIGANSSAALVFNDTKSAEETLSALHSKPHVVAASIYTKNGSLLARYARTDISRAPTVPTTGEEVLFVKGHVFVTQTITLDHETIGSVAIQYDIDEMYSRIRDYGGIAAIIMLLASLVALFLSSRFQHIISAPILSLAETARTISREKKYSLRAEKLGQDEIGTLIDGFNEMLNQIQERDAKLERQRNALEVQVAQRTAELRTANQELRTEMEERIKMEEELLRARRLDSIGILAGGIAHDFNNLLTAVLGNVSLAKMYVEPESKAFGRLVDAEKAGLRAKDLTQQLLTFSRGGAPVKRTASITELLVDSASFALSGSNVKSEFYLPEDLHPVEIDEGQMSQVMNNLIINADHAMPHGGLITVRAENTRIGEGDPLPLRTGNYVKISIKDQGPGIAKENLPKIFDPYFTTKSKGSGLGLTTCYSIVKRHDGLITVESKPGVGTTFYIYLPASDKQLSGKKALYQGTSGGKGRMLIMDDEESVRNILSEMLQHLGYEVECAGEGSEAISLYQKAMTSGRTFDALIMDLTIPGGMGGKETMQKLLELDPKVRSIVSSGYSNDPVMADFRSYGFSGVVTKPYLIEELSHVLQSVIRP